MFFFSLFSIPESISLAIKFQPTKILLIPIYLQDKQKSIIFLCFSLPGANWLHSPGKTCLPGNFELKILNTPNAFCYLTLLKYQKINPCLNFNYFWTLYFCKSNLDKYKK